MEYLIGHRLSRLGCPQPRLSGWARLGTDTADEAENAALGLPEWVTKEQRDLLKKQASREAVFIVNEMSPADVLAWWQEQTAPLKQWLLVGKGPEQMKIAQHVQVDLGKLDQKLWYLVAKNVSIRPDKAFIASNPLGKGQGYSGGREQTVGPTDGTFEKKAVPYPTLVYIPPFFEVALQTTGGHWGTGFFAAGNKPRIEYILTGIIDQAIKDRREIAVEDGQDEAFKAALDDAKQVGILAARGAGSQALLDVSEQYSASLSADAQGQLAAQDANLFQREMQELLQAAEEAKQKGLADQAAEFERQLQLLELQAANAGRINAASGGSGLGGNTTLLIGGGIAAVALVMVLMRK